MHAGRILREARTRARLSQAEVARRLGTSQPVVARWETGVRSPSYAHLTRALKACGFELEPQLVSFDAGEDALLHEWLRLSPKQRLERNMRLLETEQWARRARPVEELRQPHG
jgi:transcriptional regulator with XRE-family HTH domain